MTGWTCCGRLAAAAALAAHLICVGAATPALAMQILDAADHGELAAGISATGVNRIALEADRIRRVIRAPGGFEAEHDPETGDLWLRPVTPVTAAPSGMPGEPETTGYAPVTLFLGTEKGFTYRLTLTPSDRDSAQILIRNGAALVAGGRGRGHPRGRIPAPIPGSGACPGRDPGSGAGPGWRCWSGWSARWRGASRRRVTRSRRGSGRGPERPWAACRSSRPGGVRGLRRMSSRSTAGLAMPRTSPGPWASGPRRPGWRRPGPGLRAVASR